MSGVWCATGFDAAPPPTLAFFQYVRTAKLFPYVAKLDPVRLSQHATDTYLVINTKQVTSSQTKRQGAPAPSRKALPTYSAPEEKKTQKTKGNAQSVLSLARVHWRLLLSVAVCCCAAGQGKPRKDLIHDSESSAVKSEKREKKKVTGGSLTRRAHAHATPHSTPRRYTRFKHTGTVHPVKLPDIYQDTLRII